MDIKAELLREHSKAQTSKIVAHVGNSAKTFESLVKVYLDGPYRVTQRAAWPLSECVIKHPALIKPHLKTLLDYTQKPGVHDAVKRNTVRLLQFIDIPKRNQGQVADICFKFLQDGKEPVAVRCFSMTVLGNLANDNPGFKPELKIIIEDQLPYATAGFMARARKVLKKLNLAARI
ncbi:MAG: hypothetical protein ACOYXT_16765 [Bacteroidota bacterium]